MEENAEKRPPRAMTKYDVEMAKIARDIDRSANCRANIKAFLKYGSQMVFFVCTTICVVFMFRQLPVVLDRLAAVIREWRMAEIAHAAVTAFLAVVAWIQRRQIKRFTKKTGDMRHEIEYNDRINDRSGLRPDGTTAEDDAED